MEKLLTFYSKPLGPSDLVERIGPLSYLIEESSLFCYDKFFLAFPTCYSRCKVTFYEYPIYFGKA